MYSQVESETTITKLTVDATKLPKQLAELKAWLQKNKNALARPFGLRATGKKCELSDAKSFGKTLYFHRPQSVLGSEPIEQAAKIRQGKPTYWTDDVASRWGWYPNSSPRKKAIAKAAISIVKPRRVSADSGIVKSNVAAKKKLGKVGSESAKAAKPTPKRQAKKKK